MGGPLFKQRYLLLKKYADWWPRLFPSPKKIGKGEPGRIRRLQYFPDREDKVRVIAIGDYFSQSVLRPLHKQLFGVLRRIKQDCTFDQGKLLRELADNGGPYWSMDLSNATDRFPIDLISSVLKGYFNPEYIEAWKNIMVDQPFTLPGGGGEVRYAVGNPMGFYSS